MYYVVNGVYFTILIINLSMYQYSITDIKVKLLFASVNVCHWCK